MEKVYRVETDRDSFWVDAESIKEAIEMAYDIADATGFVVKSVIEDENAKILEKDPSGIGQHEVGAKLDSGKTRVGLVLSGFANALMEVSKIGTYGAEKYTDNGWMEVSDGIARYKDAKERHMLKEAIEGPVDKDSGLLHAAHEAWNALAVLELKLRDK